MTDGTFSQRDAGGGVQVFHASSRKFKTVAVRAYVHAPLARESVTRTAIVPHVLVRGTRASPTLTDLARRCEELYGASLGAGVAKVGDAQSLYVAVEAVEDRFLPGVTHAVRDALALLRELLLDPARDGSGHLRADVVDQEKDNLANRIRSLINDKIRYASMRCIEEMFRGEPYGLHAYGRLEDIPEIDAAAVSETYADLVEHAPIDVFAVGGEPALADEIAAAFDVHRGAVRQPPKTGLGHAPDAVRRVTETQPVDQGKLCLGYRTAVTLGDPGFTAMLTYNGILGGFPHSKLFRNVREKESLAYYASSRYDPLKGLVLIGSGIDSSRYEDAVRIIQAQVADIAAGKVTAEEFAATRAGLRNRLRSAMDSPGALIDQALEESRAGPPRALEERLAAIDAVTPDDVRAVAAGVALDTVYFLTAPRD